MVCHSVCLQLKEQELEEQRQIQANKTALAAIGPRKRRPPDDWVRHLALLSSFQYLRVCFEL